MREGSAGQGGEGTAAEAVRRIADGLAAEDGPTVVALLADADDPEASWEQASLLCDAVAERRRTLVANVAGPGSGFDEFLGSGDAEGVEGLRAGRIQLGEAPVQVEGRRFLYLPAGGEPPAAGDEAPGPLEDPELADAVETLAGKIRAAGGILLLYVTPAALPDRRSVELLDAAVRLAGAVGVAGVTTLGRLAAAGPDASVEDFLGLPAEPEGGEEAPTGSAAAGAESPAAEAGPPSTPAGTSGPGEGGPAAAGRGGGQPEETERETVPSAEDEPEPPPPEEPPGTEEPPSQEAPRREEAATDPSPAPERTRTRLILGADDGGSGWRRHRRSSGLPLGKVLLGLALVAVVAGGWWYLADRVTPDDAAAGAPVAGGPLAAGEADTSGQAGETDAGQEEAAAGQAGEADTSGQTGETDAGQEEAAPAGDEEAAPAAGNEPEGEAAPAGAGGEEPAGGAADPAVVADSPELPYSVLVASYASLSAARERIDRWSGEQGAPLLFVAPTPVGDRVYWRVFAGAVADREAAGLLNRDLVRRGWKEEATDWEVRPASLAFRLAVVGSRSAARGRVSELAGRGIPAYALPAAARGDTVWTVWAGAFETRSAAASLGRRLREGEVRAELVTRRGAPGGP